VAVLAADAEALAALVEGRRGVRASALLRRIDQRPGWAVEVVRPGASPTKAPFTAQDLDGAAAGADPVERTVSGTTWLVVARSTADGTVLVGRRLAQAVRLTPDQRRGAVLSAVLGLVGGGLAGFALASSLTRPLGRLAGAARRMSAGEREVSVPARGPVEVTDVGAALSGLSVQLASSEQRQRDFLLAVSHELRTPLTAVAGYAEALADSSLPPAEVPHAASVIVTEAARLQRRVEDLLALARLEADDFRLTAASTDVGALLRAAAAAVVPRAVQAGVRIEVEAGAVGPVVITDGERLRQIVDALVDNALRVLAAEPAAQPVPGPGSGSGAGSGAGATLVLACKATADGGVRLEVRDSGPGLTPQDLAVAFERGRLSDRYRGSRPVGSGVGLALVGELARRLGGWAQASPAPEGGVCFAVHLPARTSM
jgi:two-component system OmpR family sensor kinase